MYDFKRCKLCGQLTAKAAYPLRNAQIYRCHSCDFHFLNRLDDITGIEAASKGLDEKAWNYIEKRLGESSALLPKRLELVKEVTELSGKRCLDIGAGTGQFMHELQKEQALTAGIEPSNVRRDYALRKFGLKLYKDLIDAEYWQANYVGYFDLICLWDVIEHVNFPVATLRSACQLLKPGGHLLLDTPNRETLAYRWSEKLCRFSRGQQSLFLENFYSTAPYGHKQIFTCAQLEQLTAELGLQICSLRHSYQGGLLRGDKLILTCKKKEPGPE